MFQFIYQSHKNFAAFLEKHVKNLNLYRKNNIISPYKKNKFACTSVIAAVAISLYQKIVSTVLLVALTFLLKNFSAENHDNANTHILCNKGVYSVLH